MTIKRPLSVLLALCLSGCAAAPVDAPLAVAVPAAFSQGGEAAAGDWWTGFGDPVLTDLVGRALAQNLDVRTAASRAIQARQQARIVRGGQGPQLNASAQASRTRLSENALPSALSSLGGAGAPGSGGGLGLAGESFSTYQLGFDAAWELDLFGGQRTLREAAEARSDAAVWNERDAQVMLAAEVADTYRQYRLLQRREAYARQTVASERERLALIEARTRNGLIDGGEADQQRRVLAQATADQADLGAQAQVRLHALAGLLDLDPKALDGALSAPTAWTLAAVPPGLPSELLQRRPDIRAAAARLTAANADAGAAAADLYPKISLTGALSLASRSLSNLLDGDSLQENAATRVSLPILGRGRLRATRDLRRAQAQEARLAYRKTVRTALREVEDALTRLAADRQRLIQADAALAAGQDGAEIAAVQARNGLTAAAPALAADQSRRNAADARDQAQAQTAQDMIALYKALGGGWDSRRATHEEDRPRG